MLRSLQPGRQGRRGDGGPVPSSVASGVAGVASGVGGGGVRRGGGGVRRGRRWRPAWRRCRRAPPPRVRRRPVRRGGDPRAGRPRPPSPRRAGGAPPAGARGAPRTAQPRRQLVAPPVGPGRGVLGGIDRGGLGEHPGDLRIERVGLAVRVHGGRGGDLGAVERDEAQTAQARRGAQAQDLPEERRERRLVARPEARDGRVVGRGVGADDAVRDVPPAARLDAPRRALAGGVGVQQEGHHERRVIGRGAPAVEPVAGAQVGEVELVHGVDDHPGEVVRRQPVAQRGRHQVLLVPFHRVEVLAHRSLRAPLVRYGNRSQQGRPRGRFVRHPLRLNPERAGRVRARPRWVPVARHGSVGPDVGRRSEYRGGTGRSVVEQAGRGRSLFSCAEDCRDTGRAAGVRGHGAGHGTGHAGPDIISAHVGATRSEHYDTSRAAVVAVAAGRSSGQARARGRGRA